MCRGAGGGGICISGYGWNHSFVVVTLGGWLCGWWLRRVVTHLNVLYGWAGVISAAIKHP